MEGADNFFWLGNEEFPSEEGDLSNSLASKSDLSDTWLYWYWGKEDKVDQEILPLVELFLKNNVSKILDIGCGTGRHSIFFAKNGFDVFGFDQSDKAIQRANELAKKEKLNLNLKVWNMTIFPYPYSDSSFSAVISTKVIHHTTIGNIRKISKEILRITKRGGYLFVEVPAFIKLKRIKEQNPQDSYREIEEQSIVFLEGDEKGVIHHYFTEEELRDTFSDYRVLDLHVREEHYCLTGLKA